MPLGRGLGESTTPRHTLGVIITTIRESMQLHYLERLLGIPDLKISFFFAMHISNCNLSLYTRLIGVPLYSTTMLS